MAGEDDAAPDHSLTAEIDPAHIAATEVELLPSNTGLLREINDFTPTKLRSRRAIGSHRANLTDGRVARITEAPGVNGATRTRLASIDPLSPRWRERFVAKLVKARFARAIA